METFNLTDYQNRVHKINHYLVRISGSADALNVQAEKETLAKTIEDIKNDTFNVVVVGEFSRGKSTFVNAMLGEKLLPSSRLPTTAILNKIHYQEEPQFHIHYRNHQEVDYINQEEFDKLIAPPEPEKGDEQSQQEYEEHLEQFNEIAYASIGFPTSLCKNGVEIVDTPGTNDLETTREEITYKFIPESDAAIFLLSAKQQFTASEKRLLQQRIIENDVQKIFFVINFKDRLRTEAERKKVIDKVREQLEKVMPEEPRIYLLSAKGALNARRVANGEEVKGKLPAFEDTGFGNFEEDLSHFLSNEKGAMKLLKPIERGIKAANHLLDNSIKVTRGGLTLDLEDLERRIGGLYNDLKRARKSSSQALQRLKSLLVQGGQDLRNEIESELGMIANRAVQTVDHYKGPLTKEEIAVAIEEAVAPMQTDMQIKVKSKQQELIEEIAEQMNRRLAQEWKLLDQKVSEALFFDNEDWNMVQELREVDDNEPDSIVKAGVGSLGIFALVAGSLGLGFLAIPAAVFGGMSIFKHFEEKARAHTLGKVRNQVERRYRDGIPSTLQKVDKQWNNVVDQMVAYYEQEVDSKLQTIESQINQVLNERKQEEFKVEQKRTFLDEQERLLKESITELQLIKEELRQPNSLEIQRAQV